MRAVMARLILTWVAISLVAMLAGCSGSPLSLLTGGGPNVAANVQAGRTNAQTVGVSSVTEQRLERPRARSIEQSTGETGVRTERVERLEVRNDAAPWVWLLLLAGWLLPTPAGIASGLWGLINKGKGRRNAD